MWVPRDTKTRPVAVSTGDVVRAAIAFDVELFNLERLRAPDQGGGKAAGEENHRCGQ
jgi:hypothetical protein